MMIVIELDRKYSTNIRVAANEQIYVKDTFSCNTPITPKVE